EEQDPGGRATRAQVRERAAEIVDEDSGPYVDDEPVAVRTPAAARQLRDLADERRRQVVDDEAAEVLEHVRSLRATGTGHAGDHRDVEARCGWRAAHEDSKDGRPPPCVGAKDAG